MSSTFSFTLTEIRELELSHERLDGLYYWREVAEAIAATIEKAAKGDK